MERRLVAWACVVVAGASASCTPPPCDARDACDGVAEPNARACIEFCATIWDFETPGLAQTCAVDPCDRALWDNPLDRETLRICPTDARCEPIVPGGRVGECARAISLLDECGQPGSDPVDACGENLACLSARAHVAEDGTLVAACPNVAQAFRRSAPPSDSLCFFPAREGQLCDSNLSDREVGLPLGCAPCEEGTWCFERNLVDPDLGATRTEHRCFRPCTTAAGGPDENLCACGGEQQCRQSILPITEPGTGDDLGRFWCRPCLRSNERGCAAQDAPPCCDEGAQCHFETEFLSGGQVDLCCRQPGPAPGGSCDSGARVEECCPGSFCNGNDVCQPCARDGEPAANVACCPGHVVVGAQTGAPICARCLDERHVIALRAGDGNVPESIAYCGSESLAIIGTDGAIDGAFVPNSQVTWPRQFEGAIGGDLVRTGTRTQTAEYRLAPTHHTFLFEGLMSSGVGVGTPFIELPPDDDASGAPALVSLPDRSWTSFRTYDSGQCSAFVSWGGFAAAISAGVHRAIAPRPRPGPGLPLPANPFPSLTNQAPLTIDPFLRAGPDEIYGLARSEDELTLVATYRAGSLAGICGATELRVSATLHVDPLVGFNVGSVARASDLLLRGAPFGQAPQPLCTIDADGAHYTCQIPADDDGIYVRAPVVFPRQAGLYQHVGPVLELETLDREFQAFRIEAIRDRYEVESEPYYIEDPDCCPLDPNCPVAVGQCGGASVDGVVTVPMGSTLPHIQTGSVLCADHRPSDPGGSCGCGPNRTCDPNSAARSPSCTGAPPSCGPGALPTINLTSGCWDSTCVPIASIPERFFYRPRLSFHTDRFGARPVSIVPGARDLGLTVTDVNAQLIELCLGPSGLASAPRCVSGFCPGGAPCPDCALFPLTTGLLNARLRNELGLINNEVERALRIAIGSSATGDFQIPLASVPVCGTRPDGSPNDEACWAAPQFGGSRHSCVNVGGSFVCDALHVEPRRVNIRPDGIEIVLAQGASDPQAPLIAMRPTSSSMIASMSCEPDRLYPGYSLMSFVPGDIDLDDAPAIARSSSVLLSDARRSFCDPDSASAGTTCICSQTGTLCNGLLVRAAGFTLPTACPAGCPGSTPCCTAAATCVATDAAGLCPSADPGEAMTCALGNCCGTTTGACAQRIP